MSQEEILVRLREQEKLAAVQQEQINQLHGKIDNLNGGISRGLWILGGGFLTAFVTWLVGGGLVK